MDKKQTVMLILTVLAFVFLGYQVYQLVSNDVSESTVSETSVSALPALSSTAKTTHVTAQQATTSINPVPHAEAVLPTPVPAPAPVRKVIQAAPVAPVKRTNITSQQAYLKLVNELELAKMKRQLLQEEAAIAQAQNQIAQLHQKTQSLGGAMTTRNALVNARNANVSFTGGILQLGYIDHQNQQWSAALSEDNRYFNVTVGSLLPGGLEVVGISHHGVIVKTEQQQREMITFNGTVMLPKRVVAEMPVKMTKAVSANPAKVAPMKVVKAKAVPAKVMPVKVATPTKVAPMKVVKAKAVSAKVMPAKVATPTKAAPMKVVKAKAVPAKVMPAKVATPTKVAPMKVVKAKAVPAKVTPVKVAAPTKVAPMKVMKAKAAPVKTAPMQHHRPMVVFKKAPHRTATVKPATVLTVHSPMHAHIVSARNALQPMADTIWHTTVKKTKNLVNPNPKLVMAPLPKVATEQAAHPLLPVTQQKSPAVKRLYSADEQTILNMPSNHYTIQLVGSRNKNRVTEFASEHGLTEIARMFSVNDQGEPWYMLVMGDYQTSEQAEQALQALPVRFRGQSPWIRRFAAVQYAIRENGE